MRLLPILLIATWPLRAQFAELASTDDGGRLYFSSSLVLKGSPPATTSTPHRVYVLDENGIRLISAAATTAVVSGDGQVVGFTDPTFCSTKSGVVSCVEAMVVTPKTIDLGTGDLELSRNGRWALISQVAADFGAPPTSSILVDLQTGTRNQVPPRPANPTPFAVPKTVSSNGSLLVQIKDAGGNSAIALWQNGSVTPIPVPYSPGFTYQALALSDDGQTYLYYLRDPSLRLISRNISTGIETVLYRAPLAGPATVYYMGASRDFGKILFRNVYAGSPGNAYIADTTSGRSAPVPLPDGELVTDATLSGDGKIAFLVTTKGRMLKILVTAGESTAMEEIIPPTPYLSSAGSQLVTIFPVAPGTVVRLWGAKNISKPLGDAGILFDGRAAAVTAVVTAVDGEAVDVQVPWDVSVGLRPFRLDISPSASPFEQNQMVYINSAVATFSGASGGYLGLALVRGDFSGLLTAPPGPGDIVHLYMTGLGLVSSPPALGQHTPTDRVFPLEGTLKCVFAPEATPAETLFAGLAPEMIGIYQIDFRMPAETAPAPINGIGCTLNQPQGAWRFATCVGQNCLSQIHYP